MLFRVPSQLQIESKYIPTLHGAAAAALLLCSGSVGLAKCRRVKNWGCAWIVAHPVSYISGNIPWNSVRNVGRSLRIQSTWPKNRLIGQVTQNRSRRLNQKRELANI